MRVVIRRYIDRVGRIILHAIEHRATFYGTLLAAILQALWYGFSFRPVINDESHHFRAVQFYTHHLNPFVSQQAPIGDSLGALSRDGSYLFYYLMSWPLRFIGLFTDNATAQVIGLRLVCLSFFIGGLLLYRRALLETRLFSPGLVNAALLLFVLTPAAGLLGGMISYDNLAFLLFAALLLVTVRLLTQKRYGLPSLVGIVLLSSALVVVKWSSIALVMPVISVVIYQIWHDRRYFLPAFRTSLGASTKLQLGLLLLGVVAAAAIVIERPVMNTLRYGKPNPNCAAVLGHERCLSNATYTSYYRLAQTKPRDFHPNDPARYFFGDWLPIMSDKASNLVERGRESSLPIVKMLYYAVAYIWLVAVLLTLRELLGRHELYGVLLLIAGVYVAVLFVKEYAGYVQYGVPVAVRARYLVPILPIMLVVGMFAVKHLSGRYKSLIVLAAVPLLVLSMQGGSIVTQLFTAPDSYYWQQGNARSANTELRSLLDPIVYD